MDTNIFEVPVSVKIKPLPEHELHRLRKNFGATVRQLRKENGFINRSQFANAAGVTEDLVSTIEQGEASRKATVATLHKMAKALRCELQLRDHARDEERTQGASVILDELFRMGISPVFVEC